MQKVTELPINWDDLFVDTFREALLKEERKDKAAKALEEYNKRFIK